MAHRQRHGTGGAPLEKAGVGSASAKTTLILGRVDESEGRRVAETIEASVRLAIAPV